MKRKLPQKTLQVKKRRQRKLSWASVKILITIKVGIKVAEDVVLDGNNDLAHCIQNKTIEKKKLQLCQLEIDMGMKHKATLEFELT